MNRRGFIRAATLLIPGAVAAAHSDSSADEQPGADYFFFDDRFPRARELAADLSGMTPLTAVQSDITDVWNAGLGNTCRQSPLQLRGITTESFHFCLNIMVREQASVATQITRLDGDLYLWTMRTHQQPIR